MAGPGSLWAAIAITVVASTACSVGKALQKEATRSLPKFSLEEKILRQYLLNRTWAIGLAADLGGGILQVAAFALAPVSIVQPVSGVGLVGLALYSHFFQREKLAQWEWAAVGLAGFGTLGLGASSGGGSSGEGPGSPRPGALRMLLVLALVGAGVASLRRLRQRARRGGAARRGADSKTLSALYGLQAGGCFGLSAASCRTGFLMASRRWTWAPFGLAASVALSATGFVLQTCGLKEGSAVVVCTCVAVTSMLTGVVVGILGLGEALPGSFAANVVRLTSWNMILLGVVALAAGHGGLVELAALLLQRLPPAVWQRLPVEVAVKAKSWAATRGGLPETAAPTGGGLGSAAGHHSHSGVDLAGAGAAAAAAAAAAGPSAGPAAALPPVAAPPGGAGGASMPSPRR